MNWKQSAIQETKESLFKEKVASRIKSKPICKEKITRKKIGQVTIPDIGKRQPIQTSKQANKENPIGIASCNITRQSC